MKYYVYSRKSSEDEEKQVLSLSSQLDKSRELFSHLDLVELSPESASAFVPDNRPIFDDMIRRIQSGEAQGIVAWHPDRLSRNEIDAAKITYMLRTGKLLDLKFGSYTFDNSPEGIMMLQMVMSQSQYFSAKLSKDVKRGLEKKVSLGWFPGVAKAGYLNTPDRDKGMRVVIKDPDRFVIVRKMWDLMLTGNYSIRQVVAIANTEWGFTTRQTKKMGGNPLGLSTAYKLFTSQFYAGVIEYKGETYSGSHEPMVTLAEFDLVQEILGRKGKPRPKTHQFAFTGLIRCAECGCMYTAETKVKVNAKTGLKRFYTYYHCTRKRRDLICSQRTNIREEELEGQIDALLSRFTILPEFNDWALDVLNSSNDNEIKERTQIQLNLTRKTLSLQKQIDSLTQMRYRELINDEEFASQKSTLKAALHSAQAELHDSETRAANWLGLTESAFNFATYARENFKHGDLNTKKSILRSMGQNPLMRDGILTIEPNRWLVPIIEDYPQLEESYRQVRTDNNASPKEKTEAFASVNNSWLRRSGSNRRPSG